MSSHGFRVENAPFVTKPSGKPLAGIAKERTPIQCPSIPNHHRAKGWQAARKMCENDLMQVGSSASLDGLCDRLLRSTAACKVLVCTIEGAVVAHAGERNILRGALASEVADLAADLILETQQASHLEIPVEDRYVTLAVPKDNPSLGAMQLGAAPLGHRALLLVLFAAHVDAGQVRVRVRRARPQMLRLLSSPSLTS